MYVGAGFDHRGFTMRSLNRSNDPLHTDRVGGIMQPGFGPSVATDRVTSPEVFVLHC
jgi:hypothetical protein